MSRAVDDAENAQVRIHHHQGPHAPAHHELVGLVDGGAGFDRCRGNAGEVGHHLERRRIERRSLRAPLEVRQPRSRGEQGRGEWR